MKKAIDSPNESDRVAALEKYGILDTPPDAALESIAQTAADLCDAPIAVISLIDSERQWFKACIGMPIREISRDHAFCTHAIMNPDELMEVEDASQDERFYANPLVTGEPYIRFYASKSLVTPDGYALGTLCVFDSKPRVLSSTQRKVLVRLAQTVVHLFCERQQFPITAIDHIVEQAVQHGVLITDPNQPDNPIVYVNRAFELLTGYSKTEVQGRNCRLLQGPDTDPDSVRELRNAIAEQRTCTTTLKNYRKDGEGFWNELTVSPVKDSEGTTVRFVGIQQDVSSRYLAQLRAAQLNTVSREKEEVEEGVRLRDRAIDAVDVGVTITDARQAHFPLVYVNQMLCTMTGYKQEELIGQGVRILQKGNRHQPEHLQIQTAQANGDPVQVLLTSTRKDGSQFMDELSLSPVHDATGALTHYIGINRDVTERLKTQAKLHRSQKIEAIGQLAGGIAHDFNNLLSVISGNLEFLAMDATSKEHREYLDEADSAAKMGARLTHRLLTFAKQGRLEPTVLNANEHVLSVLELLRSTIGENIALSSHLSTDLWSIRADSSGLENAVVNLAINARDAMPAGGKLTITTRNISFNVDDVEFVDLGPGDYVQLSVSDTGCGMSDEVKSRIFEPFFTTKETGKGTGLGLASIYGFAQQSGGSVRVYSEVDQGTVISVYLPRHIDKSVPGSVAQPLRVQSSSAEYRILLVEDNDMVRKVTAKRLHALGYHVIQASNGPDAVRQLEQGAQVQLVLTDIVMEGGMSGYDVAHWVQMHLPACKILLTSGFNEQMAEASNVVTDQLRVLQKPYSMAELQQAIMTAMESSGGDA